MVIIICNVVARFGPPYLDEIGITEEDGRRSSMELHGVNGQAILMFLDVQGFGSSHVVECYISTFGPHGHVHAVGGIKCHGCDFMWITVILMIVIGSIGGVNAKASGRSLDIQLNKVIGIGIVTGCGAIRAS